jgi:alkylhydroperoxidase family enzyme
MSVRGAVAQQQGADEELLAEVDHYEDSTLSPFQKAALRLADAYLTYPAGMADEVRAGILAHLTSAQVAELVLKLMGYSSDKIMVALGLDLEETTIIPFG